MKYKVTLTESRTLHGIVEADSPHEAKMKIIDDMDALIMHDDLTFDDAQNWIVEEVK